MEEYTTSDINWKNPLARCNKEKIGKKDIPIRNKLTGFEDFDTVFLGFPIWYYGAPNIIQSFVKEYDWTGKKVALFATSGGSAIGKTAEKLQPFFNGKGEIADARLFTGSVTKEDLKEWAESILDQ